MSTKEESIYVSGTVTEVLPGLMFHVTLPNGHVVLGHVAGRDRKDFPATVAGDRVELEMTPYDLSKARILRRAA